MNISLNCFLKLFLYQVTWERIDCFLPNLRNDLVATQSPVSIRATSPPEPDIPAGMTMHDSDKGQGVSPAENKEITMEDSTVQGRVGRIKCYESGWILSTLYQDANIRLSESKNKLLIFFFRFSNTCQS